MRLYVLLALLLSSIPSISQKNCNYTLSGSVKDLHDGSLLAGATLILAGTEQAVLSDLDGNYMFSGLCEGTYAIQVSHPYCLSKGFTIKVNGDTTSNFLLEHHLEELSEVVLEGEAYRNQTKTLFENKISNAQLEDFSSGTLGDALNSISGVSSLNTGNTVVKPMINGLHSSRIVIVNNGVRMEDQEWGAEHGPNVDINSAGSLTLIKGAGALRYGGDAVGGVIVAEAPKLAQKDTLFGKTLWSASSNGRGSSVSSQLTKSYKSGWYGSLQGTVKRYGDFETPDYVLSNTGAFERNASLRFGLKGLEYGIEGYYSLFKNDIGILRASHLGGAQDQVRAINNNRPLIIRDFTYNIGNPRQEVTHHLARLNIFQRFDGLGKLSLQYDFQRNSRQEFDIRRGDDADKASLDLELDTHTLMLDLDGDLLDTGSIKLGAMARYQSNFADPTTGVRRLIPDYDKYDLGVYAIADYRVKEKLVLEAGVRFDYSYMDVFKFYRTSFWEARNYDQLFPEIVVEELGNQILTNPQLDFYNTSATAGATYSFNEQYILFFNYSLASRPPNPSELFSEGLHHSASRIELGDLRFGPEISNKLALTFQRKNTTFGFSVNPYINTIGDFMVIEPTDVQQTVRGNFQVWEYRQTKAQLLGVDVDASWAFAKNFRFNHQFSMVKGYDRNRNEALINMPPVTTQNGVVFQNKNLRNLKLALQSEYMFRQNEFPDNNFEVFVPETQTLETVDVSTPPEAYHLLNFSSSIDLYKVDKSKLTIGVTVSNLLDTSYRNYLNRLRYYADDLGRNFLLNLKFNY